MFLIFNCYKVICFLTFTFSICHYIFYNIWMKRCIPELFLFEQVFSINILSRTWIFRDFTAGNELFKGRECHKRTYISVHRTAIYQNSRIDCWFCSNPFDWAPVAVLWPPFSVSEATLDGSSPHWKSQVRSAWCCYNRNHKWRLCYPDSACRSCAEKGVWRSPRRSERVRRDRLETARERYQEREASHGWVYQVRPGISGPYHQAAAKTILAALQCDQ